MTKKWLPIAAIIIFTLLIWPWPEKDKPVESSQETTAVAEKQDKSRVPQRKGDPAFKPKVVEQPESTKKEEEFFRVTAPEAIAYAENDRLAYEQGAGTTPAITQEQLKESKQLQSVVEAVNNPKEFANRLSPLHKATKFDRDKFLNDKKYREEYLATAEPGRVYQVDSKSEYKIKRVSPYYQEVNQGESVTISVQAEPLMPVSITSYDLGKFANHLTFQTVLADASGVATFEYFGVKGTFNDANLLSSSPSSRGQVKFVVHTKIIKKENNN